jgi:hypothetical protein
MDTEVKKAWLERLRNPKSRKAIGSLKDDEGGLCCLGHLCKLFPNAKFIRGGFNEKDWYFLGRTGDLPAKVREWAMLASEDPIVIYKGCKLTLSNLNDGDFSPANEIKRIRGLTLSQIADLIDEQL